MFGMHWYDALLAVIYLAPIIVGVFWIRPDANRQGKPGWIWALLTIPFGWFTVLIYAVMRSR